MAIYNWYDQSGLQARYRKQYVDCVRQFAPAFEYLPKTVLRADELTGEDIVTQFNTAYACKFWLESSTFYDGNNQVFNNWGLTLDDQLRVTVEINHFTAQTGLRKPEEGDLIALKMGTALSIYNDNNKGYEIFRIVGINPKRDFYKFGTMYLYEIFCDRYTFAGEHFSTALTSYKINEIATADLGDGTVINDFNDEGISAFNEQTSSFVTTGPVSTYVEEDPFKVDSVSMTSNLIPLSAAYSYFQFEQLVYSGLAGEVINSISTSHGTASPNVFTSNNNGKFSNYSIFNGAIDSFIDSGNKAHTSIKTLATWVRFTKFDDKYDYYAFGVKEDGHNLFVGVDKQGQVFAGFGDQYIGHDNKIKQFAGIGANVWYRFVLTYNSAIKQAIVYINNVKVIKFACNAPSSISANNLFIGALNNSGVAYPVPCIVDEFITHKQYWTGDMVANDWNNGYGRIKT